MKKIKNCKYGIAHVLGSGKDAYIEVNKNLKKYPKLYKSVIAHELGHLKNNKKIDLLYEIKERFNLKRDYELMKFSFKHPSAFLEWSPIWITKKGIAWDSFHLIITLLIIGGLIL